MVDKDLSPVGAIHDSQFAGLAVDEIDDTSGILYAMQRSSQDLSAYQFTAPSTLTVLWTRTLTALYSNSGMGIALDDLQDPPILWVADCGNMMIRAYDTSTWVEDTTLSFSTASTGRGAIGMGIDRRRGIIYWGSMNYGAWVPPNAGSDHLYKYDLATKVIASQDIGTQVVDVSVDEDTGLVYLTETTNVSVWDTTTTPWSMLDRHVLGDYGAGIAVTNVSYMPDLKLDKVDDVADGECVPLGGNINYTLSYANEGDVDLTGVTVVDDMPPEVSFVSCTGGCTTSGAQVTWDIGDVAQGVSASVSLVVEVNSGQGTTIINYATISSDLTSPATVQENTDICANQPPVADPNGPYLGAAGTPIVFDGNGSTDPDGDPLTYDWDWDDTTSSPNAGATPSHTYGAAGIYEVCLTVTDPGLLSDTACTIAVVYDPSAGFVTGGGWIDSPAGAYAPDTLLEGRANFGFVSKYKKGADTPTGQTEFQFQAGDLNFHSDSYEWLVVTGSDYARYKGNGAINGEGDYKFMLWAGDGTGTDGADTFRIKIWAEDDAGNETVIYDNGMDQDIGGGSIVVHAK
jgi:uncharacterized repeat protein (TIGR01451 family)